MQGTSSDHSIYLSSDYFFHCCLPAQAQEKDLNNAIINAAFLLLYKDLIRLFASYNEGMINLIEKYFTLKLKECRLGMELYHNFPGILDKITEFLTLAESLGIGDKDSLGLQPVPEKVIHAMEQHLAILESKKGSDDEEEAAVDHRTPRPAPPKKPAVPVPLPASKPAEPKPKPMEHPTPDRVTSVQETTTAVVPSAAESQEDAETTQPATNTEEEQEDQSAIRPTVVVNDEEGLPSILQEEVIAAATSHLAETIDKSNEAVKRSARQTTVSPIHTQMGRSEQRTVSVRSGAPSRSRSPSPGRPVSRPKTIPTHEIVNSASDTDLKAHTPVPNLSSGGRGSNQNLSVHGLNEPDERDGGASPICGSPFEGDEKIVEPATGVEDWPEPAEEPESKFDAQFGTPAQSTSKPPPAPTQTTTGSSVMDDLLDLDLLDTGPIDSTPVPIPTPITPNSSVPMPSAGTATNTSAPVKTGLMLTVLDDLLSLDPLLGSMDPVPPPTTAPTSTTTIPVAGGSITLPPGLKQVNSNVPIRPAAPVVSTNKNALDSLDSTLMNLASSLGGQQGWGSSQIKKRPIANTAKPQVS
ncbi:Phosphatidylinositol-binding clathrin assembly protein [Fasciolopsis buskii]|uniref:Phosphatidylinositol-binding clathrin assembly protein n=1 Tax=Fasciolopsis buskii TaxID=27845 RepID=A0A8E0RWL6_9TREM|nr:Phosphatidylinositol-binding clathrin assembly protein [Fasciolopsis buski]